MRDKFSQMIQQGVASFNYTPIAPEIPEQDPICRTYNNIFSIPTDTHMSLLDDGSRIITGRMVAKEQWAEFLMSNSWGSVNFADSGTWCLCAFLAQYGLCGKLEHLNGEMVYRITPYTEKKCPTCPTHMTTMDSKIPQSVAGLAIDSNIIRVKECFKGDMMETVKNLNESLWIKGNNWTICEDHIIGLVGNKVYIL